MASRRSAGSSKPIEKTLVSTGKTASTPSTGPTANATVATSSKGNIWLDITPPEPTPDEIAVFDAEHHLTPQDYESWKLPAGEHAISRACVNSLGGVEWLSPVFTRGSKFEVGESVYQKLVSYLSESSTIISETFRTPTIATLTSRIAKYIDSWSTTCHTRPILQDYKAYGLVPTPPGFTFPRNEAAPKNFTKVASLAIALDRMVAGAGMWADIDAYVTSAKLVRKRYKTTLGSLDSVNRIYHPAQNVTSHPLARLFHDTANWRSYFQAFATRDSVAPSLLDPTQYSSLARKLIENAEKAELKANGNVAEANIMRVAFGVLTMCGLIPVRKLVVSAMSYN